MRLGWRADQNVDAKWLLPKDVLTIRRQVTEEKGKVALDDVQEICKGGAGVIMAEHHCVTTVYAKHIIAECGKEHINDRVFKFEG